MAAALDFWKTLEAHLQADRRVFLALVAAHDEHSPGTTGAKMLVPETGDPLGSMGGGIMEHTIIERSRTVLAGSDAFVPEIQVLDHRPQKRPHRQGKPSGLVCAGSQTNLYYLCTDQDHAAVEQIVSLVTADRPGVLTIEPAGMRVSDGVLDRTRSEVVLTQKSATWRYEEQLLNRKRLVILGGGHCSLALSRLMHWLGYVVLVFDTRPDIRSFEDNPYAHTIRVDNYATAAPHILYPEWTEVVLMTNAFEADVQALQDVLPLPVPYIGLMGSYAKIGRVFKTLRDAGVSKESLARVVAPVGLPIESDTPEEIAVSVAAQLIHRRKIAGA